jgi:signal transduction histidine kinase
MSEIDTLREEIRRQQEELDGLQMELAETNKGVLALYAELDQNALQLREAADLKSRFLSYMSHEFRTPLASITSVSDILLGRLDGPLTQEQERQLKFVQGSVRELSEMVDDLLDLAKVEAGRISISPEWFKMVDLFSALRGMFRPIVGTSSVSLVFEEPEQLPPIYTDDKKLAQILRNFISNALKFTVEGEVSVSVRMVDGAMIEFALFSDFVQLDTRIQKRLRGTGLGLSLARKFAELLGGSVAVESEIGKGSRFSVKIPARYSAAGSPP